MIFITQITIMIILFMISNFSWIIFGVAFNFVQNQLLPMVLVIQEQIILDNNCVKP